MPQNGRHILKGSGCVTESKRHRYELVFDRARVESVLGIDIVVGHDMGWALWGIDCSSVKILLWWLTHMQEGRKDRGAWGITLFYTHTHTPSHWAFIDSNTTGFQARGLAP
jgi:hypothetical protein